MPVIKSAIKKLRKDRKREKENDTFRAALEKAIKAAKKAKTAKSVSSAVSIIDKAVKKNLLHKNRAARFKSQLSKLARPDKAAVKTATKSSKKTSPKKSTGTK
jgi:small subunit ribosomal protein S20